jgi:hypothetical protein
MCQMRQIYPPKNNKDTESLVYLRLLFYDKIPSIRLNIFYRFGVRILACYSSRVINSIAMTPRAMDAICNVAFFGLGSSLRSSGIKSEPAI